MHAESGAFDTGARRQIGKPLESTNELRPAVGVAGIIEGVDADDDVLCAEDLGPSEREREEDRVARRNIGGWNAGGLQIAIVRHRNIRRERRPPDRTKVDVELEMPFDPQRLRHRPRRLDFAPVTLAVVDRKGEQTEPLRLRDCGGCVRIEAAAQQYYGSHWVIG